MKYFTFLFFLIVANFSFSQTMIYGKVINQDGSPIELVQVYIKGTQDVATSNSLGKFTLKTKAQGNQTIVFRSDEVDEQSFQVLCENNLIVQVFKVKGAAQIEEVVISAGSIEAKNDRSVALLDPIDIVTTAGGQGDIAGAIQTLPGVQRNGGDQTGLQVRGGDVNETSVIVDNLVAQNAFGSTVPGVGQRTRFNPFQFKGTSFSSGGYSARFGQALSSILDLTTNDLPDESNISLGGSMAGINVSGTKLMENNAIEFTGSYFNLSPYFLLAQANVDFYQKPQGFTGSMRYTSKTKNGGFFKTTFTQSYNATGINLTNPADATQLLKFGIKNENTYIQSNIKDKINDKWVYFAGVSVSNNSDNISWGSANVLRDDKRVQARGEFIYAKSIRYKMVFGSDVQRFSYTQKFDTLLGQFNEFLSAAYVEADIIPFRKFAIKPGVRAEYSQLIARGNISPRLAMAYKISKNSQFSFASGYFYQLASNNYYLFGYRPKFQEAIHVMTNYQLIKNSRIFRIEGYYKSYDQLVREQGQAYTPNAFRFNLGNVDNSGSGYAKGIDFFFRDRKTIKNFDYWISYSYIDTKRLYQNYTATVTPDYVSDNNLNIVTKYFSEKLQTSISATYSFASGRRYYNPNNPTFFGDKAPDYHNFALTAAYLHSFKKVFSVFFVSIDNIANRKNVLGYQYNADGSQRFETKPPFYFNLFFGFNLSLTKFNKDEL